MAVEKKQALSFIFVGTVGFIADAGMLTLLFHVVGMGPYIARGVAFIFAVTVTWILNRTYTFQTENTGKLHHEYLRYLGTQVVGAGINFGIYALCLQLSNVMQSWPVLALAVGSVVAMAFNFVAMKYLVFKPSVN